MTWVYTKYLWYNPQVKILPKVLDISQAQLSLADFLKSYNKNIPQSFPRATEALLQKFKAGHESFFKHGELWSLDEHRKKIVDWMQLNQKELG
jgi:hypothetical protein